MAFQKKQVLPQIPIEEDYSQIQAEYERHQNEQQNQNLGIPSAFGSYQDDNLVKFQLELDNILERIDHLLRGHIISYDKNGSVIWKEPNDVKERVLSDYGVNEVMRVLNYYINRNLILSNFDEEEIRWKMYDLGVELKDLFYLKAEEMGLDTPDKQKLYPILVRLLVDSVHASYNRALYGGERDSLREARHVTQNEAMNQGFTQHHNNQRKELGIFNPRRYFGGMR